MSQLSQSALAEMRRVLTKPETEKAKIDDRDDWQKRFDLKWAEVKREHGESR